MEVEGHVSLGCGPHGQLPDMFLATHTHSLNDEEFVLPLHPASGVIGAGADPILPNIESHTEAVC